MLTDNELGELVVMLQAKSPLHQLSNMRRRLINKTTRVRTGVWCRGPTHMRRRLERGRSHAHQGRHAGR